MAKQTLWQRIKGFFGGGNKQQPAKKSSAPKRVTREERVEQKNTGGGSFNKREFLNRLTGKDSSEKETRYKSMADAINTSNNRSRDFVKTSPPKTRTAIEDPKIDAAKKSRAEMRKKLEAKKQENKEWHEATNNRFNVNEEGISKEEKARRRQNIKSRAYDSRTAVKEAEHTMKWHGKEMSFARGALSGATFGASDLAAKKLTKGEAKKAEEVYQANKSKGWETAGEIAGSLASFGATAGATEKAAAKIGSKVAPKAAEKLAESQIIKSAAKRSVNKAVKKGLVGEASEELIKQVGKDKAKQITRALGTDIVQNLTTGALYDINRASTEHEVGSSDWWKELGKSAALNFGITGGIAGVSALRGGRQLAVDAAETVANRTRARNSLDSLIKNNSIGEARPTQRIAPRIGESIEDRIARVNAERLGARADDVAENVARNADDVATTSAREVADVADNEAAERLAQIEREMDDAHRVAGDVNATPEERQAAADRFAELNNERERMTSNADEATETTARQGAESTTSSTRKEPPKTKAAREAAEEAAEAADNTDYKPKMRGRYDHLNKELKQATEGKVGIRKGIIAAEERASDEERKRILRESGGEFSRALKEAAENAFHGGDFTYKVFTQGQNDKLFFDSYDKARKAENVATIVEELEEKMDKILRESEDNPWGISEQITLKDLSDMLAVEQLYKDAGKTLPPEYEEILTRLTTLQGTQYGQGMRARHLILMERSPRYREAMLTKDTAKYIDRVFGEDRFKDISRSLDKNHGEKNYLENELKRIADYDNTFANLPVEERRAAAEQAHRELEKDILRNAKMSVWDVINLYRHTGMLSALATGGRNMLGNVSQFMMRELADKATYFAERGMAKAGGMGEDFRPTTVLTYKGKDSKKLANQLTSGAVGKLTKTDDAYFAKFSDPEYAKTITNTINDAVADMMNIEKYETHAQKGQDYVAEKAGEKLVKGLAWLPRKTTKAVNFMLNEPDSWFVETRFRKGLMRYLEANGITDSASLAGKDNILKDAVEHAKSQALEDTYKKANRVTSFLEKIRSAGLKHDDNVWKNLAKKGAMITLDAELPYLKVPVNVGINTVKYSPINIVKSLVDANTAIRRGDAKALSKAAEELSKGLTGTGLATLGFLLNCDEQDSEDSNGFIAKAQDALKEYGIKDYSLKIGDHVYDISNIGQGATQLLMGARAAEVINENGGAPKGFLDKLDLIRECFAAPVDSIAEMGILDNALGIVDAFSNEGDYEKGFAERVGDAATNIGFDYAGQFIPQPLRGVARGTTSADLDTNVKKTDTTPTKKRLQYNANQFVSSIPVVNEKVLPHKVDTHGNLMNERKTNQDKLKAVLNNTVNPVKATKVHIPEADKVELSVKNDKGEPFKPSGFDSKREYKVKVGSGQMAEELDLTGKEREQVARAAKNSGYDMANALVKHGMFGDRLGDRAQEILKTVPDDEEKAREMFFATSEWQNADNATKNKYLNIMYGQSGGGKNNEGVSRTRKAEAYINLQGNSEGDFRFQNDLNWQNQKKYVDKGLEEVGIDKGTWADIVQATYDANHKWDEEKGNVDTPNSAKKVKAGILSVEGLTPEQRIAAYEAFRGKRNGFGWYDWDGVSGGGSGYYRGYRRGWRHYGRGGGGSRKATVPKIDAKSMASSVKKATATKVKLEPPTLNSTKVAAPKPKFKKYEV